MTHSLACATCCSLPLVFSFSFLLNLGSKARSCTQQSAGGEKPAPPLQRGVYCISGEPVSVAPLNCENLSLVDCQTYRVLSMPAVGRALLSSLFLRRETPVSHWSAEGASGTIMLVPFFFADSSDRLARVIRACCLLSRNGFAVCLLRLYLWAIFQIVMPTLCSSCATGCSLLPVRIIRACLLLTRIGSSG